MSGLWKKKWIFWILSRLPHIKPTLTALMTPTPSVLLPDNPSLLKTLFSLVLLRSDYEATCKGLFIADSLICEIAISDSSNRTKRSAKALISICCPAYFPGSSLSNSGFCGYWMFIRVLKWATFSHQVWSHWRLFQ